MSTRLICPSPRHRRRAGGARRLAGVSWGLLQTHHEQALVGCRFPPVPSRSGDTTEGTMRRRRRTPSRSTPPGSRPNRSSRRNQSATGTNPQLVVEHSPVPATRAYLHFERTHCVPLLLLDHQQRATEQYPQRTVAELASRRSVQRPNRMTTPENSRTNDRFGEVEGFQINFAGEEKLARYNTSRHVRSQPIRRPLSGQQTCLTPRGQSYAFSQRPAGSGKTAL